MPAPKKNRNAVKPEGEKASTWLHVRVILKDKQSWQKEARALKITMSSVVVDLLNRWSGNK